MFILMVKRGFTRNRWCAIISKKGGDFELLEEIALSDKGKTLRIINPFPIDNEDCKTLAYCSKNPVGCTGDMFLSEVISFLKTYID